MPRFSLLLAAATGAILVAAPALAADFSSIFGSDSDMRSGFSADDDWANTDVGDPLTFELGLRYWYSWGAQNFNVDTGSLKDSDTTQSVEAHFRVDDASTRTYAKALGGLSFKTEGTATNTSLLGMTTTSAVTDGHIAYAGGDVGYSWLGDTKSGATLGPFAGYMYWNDSPDLGRANFTTGTSTNDFSWNGFSVTGPGNSVEDGVEINALRLGFSGKANLGSMFDVSGELAAVPYANISGVLGAFSVPTVVSGTDAIIQSSPVSINGWGYGAMGEVMFGMHPTSNLTFRLGGRAWYLQGTADTTFNTITVTNDNTHTVVGSQAYIQTSNPWSLFRYGALAEMTYNF